MHRHTHTNAYMHTYTHTHLHTYTLTHKHTFTHPSIHPSITCMHACIHTYIPRYIGEQHEWPIFPGEIGPMEPLIPEGFMLRGLKESEDCRMSREVGPVFCIGFRMRARKPQQLFPARFRGRRCPAGVLELVNGKDGVSSQPQLPGFQCNVAGQNCKVLRAPGFQGCRLRKLQGSRVLDYQSSGVPGFQGWKVPGFKGPTGALA
jgi:hypothetical protein